MKIIVLSVCVSLIALSACITTDHEKVILRDAQQLDAFVGKTVTLVGIQVDVKRPTIHGVLVKGPDEWAHGKEVAAEGVLLRVVRSGHDPFEDKVITNVWYELINPRTSELAEGHMTKKGDAMSAAEVIELYQTPNQSMNATGKPER